MANTETIITLRDHKIFCPSCNVLMVFRQSRYGAFYGCPNYPECDMAHGANQKTGQPLGTPADKETRQWRVKAHKVFDKLWTTNLMTRKDAYDFMHEAFALNSEDAHIAKFDSKQCAYLCAISKLKLRELRESLPYESHVRHKRYVSLHDTEI